MNWSRSQARASSGPERGKPQARFGWGFGRGFPRVSATIALAAVLLAEMISLSSSPALAQNAAKSAPSTTATAARVPMDQLKSAVGDFNARRYTQALQKLQGLESQLPALADYVAWVRGSALNELKEFAAVPRALDGVFRQQPASPMTAQAAMLAAAAYRATDQPEQAIQTLRTHYQAIPAPQADMAMADAFWVSGDKLSAAVYYQRVYFEYPFSPAAKRAGAEMLKLKDSLGDQYPPVMGHALLGRAQKLLDGGQPNTARTEFEALVTQLGGSDRDLARVRIGAARFGANEISLAVAHLKDLQLESPEADAERLYLLSESARLQKRYAEMDKIALGMAQSHPGSPWTAMALRSAGNYYLNENAVDRYEPLYHACFEALPADPRSDWCHWKYTWVHYMRRQADAGALLRQHLRMYPDSDEASASLYFLARLAEADGDRAGARAYYEEAAAQYPNHYYATISRERLDGLGAGQASVEVKQFLSAIAFPERLRTQGFDIEASTRARIDRAAQLVAIDRKDWAERELRFGAEGGEQSHILAMELARLMAPGSPDQALRYIKRYAAGYLFMPIESAPPEFWQLTFPLPYRDVLEKQATNRDVDPLLMAGLVRQESEFNATARSRTGARGLSQIQPATGEDIARRLKVQFSAAKLTDPAYNLDFGSYYLRLMLNQNDGRPEVALAAYNGGPTRAKRWLTWGEFREPAEYIETIPFTETRGYVQAVLRNAAAYRAIYGPARAAGK